MENNEPKPGYLGPNLDGHKGPVPEAAWEQIEAGLNKRKRRGFFFWLLGGMAVLLLGTCLWFTQLKVKPSEVAIHQSEGKQTDAVTSDNQSLKQPENQSSVEQSKPIIGSDIQKPLTQIDKIPEQTQENEGSEQSHVQPDLVSEPTAKEIAKEKRKPTRILKESNFLAKAPLSSIHENGSSKRGVKAQESKLRSKQKKPKYANENIQNQPTTILPEVAEGAITFKKPETQEGTKQESEIKQPVANEVPLHDEQGSERKKALSYSENVTGNQEKMNIEPIAPVLTLIPVPSPENEKTGSVPVKVDSTKKKVPPLVVSADSINPKPDTTQIKPWKRDPFWLFSVNAGVMQQNIQIIQSTLGYFVQKGSPIVTQNSKDVSPAPSVKLAFGRLWPIIRSFHLGVDGFANGFFQQASAVLTPSTGSPIQYQYGSDSLSIIAKTDFIGQKETYSRKTLVLGFNIRFQWKPRWSPIGIQGRKLLFSYKWDWPHESADVFEASNNSEVGLWLPYKKTHQISLDFNRILWGNQSLPIPVENRGKNWVISLGFGWKW